MTDFSFTQEDFDQLLSTKAVAKKFGLTEGKIRRLAHKGEVPGYRKILGQFAFVKSEIEGWEPPTGSARRGGGAKKTAEDGTPLYRWTVWASKEGAEQLKEAGYDISDPRAKAAARRERRAAKAAAEAGETVVSADDDPFAGLD